MGGLLLLFASCFARATTHDVQAVLDIQRAVRGGMGRHHTTLVEEVPPLAFLQTGARAKWRFGSNYVPQHYGNWQFSQGTWNFGNDKRIECECCGYVAYMLIDRLGDEFNRETVVTEMNGMCDRVQWVFRSGCEYIFERFNAQLINMVMRLTEPEDICKQLALCAPDFYDSQMAGGVPGMAPGVFPAGGMGQPWHGFGQGMSFNQLGTPVAVGHPGMGYTGHSTGMGYGMYPPPGARPMGPQSPYSPYSYGGYDAYGFPQPHPGVPSSTPPPPLMGSEGGR